jgi:hypothetical protein
MLKIESITPLSINEIEFMKIETLLNQAIESNAPLFISENEFMEIETILNQAIESSTPLSISDIEFMEIETLLNQVIESTPKQIEAPLPQVVETVPLCQYLYTKGENKGTRCLKPSDKCTTPAHKKQGEACAKILKSGDRKGEACGRKQCKYHKNTPIEQTPLPQDVETVLKPFDKCKTPIKSGNRKGEACGRLQCGYHKK